MNPAARRLDWGQVVLGALGAMAWLGGGPLPVPTHEQPGAEPA